MLQLKAAERKKIAASLEVDEQYLYQCLTGRRQMKPVRAIAIEQKAQGRIKRWHINSRWREIWPDLVGLEDEFALDAPVKKQSKQPSKAKRASH